MRRSSLGYTGCSLRTLTASGMFSIFSKIYLNRFGTNGKVELIKSIRFILHRNILWGDALDFTNPISKKPIVFSEWSMINENMIKRRDFVFKFLVEKTHQFSMFNDEGNPAAIDEPVKDFPPLHFLKLG